MTASYRRRNSRQPPAVVVAVAQKETAVKEVGAGAVGVANRRRNSFP
jgi:hypothetical protein